MCKGWRLLLTAAVVALVNPSIRATDTDTQIRCEIRVVRVSDECFEKMCKRATVQPKPTCCDQSACCPKSGCCEQQTCGEKSSCCEKGNCCEKPACCPKPCCDTAPKSCRTLPATMSVRTAKLVMEAVQSDPRCHVMCCPRVMTLNNQPACVQVNDVRCFVTHLMRLNIGGQQTEMPINEQFSTGCRMWVRPMLSPDGKHLFMNVECEIRELERDPAPLFPVTTMITPTFEGGSQGQPIPFTQFVQQPSFTTRGAHRIAACGDGQTMVLDCGRSTRTRETDNSVPFLCDLPVVGELFQSKSTEVVSDRLVVFVTPCVCTGELGEECTLPAPVTEELPLFAQPAMCLPPETLPVAPRPCTPPCVVPCPSDACPAAAALTQATAAVVRPCGVWAVATPVTPPVPCCPAQAAACPFACPVPPPPPVRMVRAASAVVPCSASDLPLVNLMIEYHEACAAGDRAKARNLAAKCIALDPMCFSR